MKKARVVQHLEPDCIAAYYCWLFVNLHLSTRVSSQIYCI